MTCYTPFIRKELRNRPKQKALDGHLYYKAQINGTHKDYNRTELEEITNMWGAQIIPCGHCIGCRLEYAKEWANRGYLESKLHKESWFLTLTYNDKSLPKNNSLNKRDLTLFIKRLRRKTEQKFSYMACGEYGEEGDKKQKSIKKTEREKRSLSDLEQLAVEERYTQNRSIALIRAMEKAK